MDQVTVSWAQVAAALAVRLEDVVPIEIGQGRSWRAAAGGDPVIVKWD